MDLMNALIDVVVRVALPVVHDGLALHGVGGDGRGVTCGPPGLAASAAASRPVSAIRASPPAIVDQVLERVVGRP